MAHLNRLTKHQAEEQPGFTDGLLTLLEGEQDHAIRLSSTGRAC
jgi:hypothetical protein